jgi:DNA-binding LacI/PurR family transcriptional regulator
MHRFDITHFISLNDHHGQPTVAMTPFFHSVMVATSNAFERNGYKVILCHSMSNFHSLYFVMKQSLNAQTISSRKAGQTS